MKFFRTKNPQDKRKIILNYAQYDIFACINQDQEVLQLNILQSNNKQVQEQGLKLINSIASDYQGRSYLIQSNQLIKILIQLINIEKEDNMTRRHALGTLQKLSLRKKTQLIIIEKQMIKTIIQILQQEKESLSEYSYEYATALLMNLSLRSIGKDKFEEINKEALQVISEILEHENIQVRTFINGMLYSLFSRSKIREQAKAIGMGENLTFLLENQDDRFQKQIQYILDQLNTDSNNQDETKSDDQDNEDDTDVDEIDDEEEDADEDADDEDEELNLDLAGEELLDEYFQEQEAEHDAHEQNESFKQDRQFSSKPQNYSTISQKEYDDEPNFNRPVTPSIKKNKLATQEVPEELESRPKIPRTPLDGTRPKIDKLIQSLTHNQSYNQLDPQKAEFRKQIADDEEYRNAFLNKPRIPRTPEGVQK